jgi:hypothetical protein
MANLSIKVSQRGSARPLLYVGIAVAIAMWSYYAVDYSFGFVRRGLASELVGLVPGHYFEAALGLRRLSTETYLCVLLDYLDQLISA